MEPEGVPIYKIVNGEGQLEEGAPCYIKGPLIGRAPPVPNMQQDAFRRNLRAFWPTATSMNELRAPRIID